MKKENTKNNKGFSLVELIVVIAIMAVLMTVLAPVLLRYVEKSRTQTDETAVSEVIQATKTALADETVNTSCAVGDTVTCTNGSITSTNQDLLDEIHNTIADTDFKLKSKTHGGHTYTITLEAGPDGVTLQPDAYDAGHWT